MMQRGGGYSDSFRGLTYQCTLEQKSRLLRPHLRPVPRCRRLRGSRAAGCRRRAGRSRSGRRIRGGRRRRSTRRSAPPTSGRPAAANTARRSRRRRRRYTGCRRRKHRSAPSSCILEIKRDQYFIKPVSREPLSDPSAPTLRSRHIFPHKYHCLHI